MCSAFDMLHFRHVYRRGCPCVFFCLLQSKVTGSKSIDDIDAAFEDAAESPSSEAGTPDDKADPSSIPPKDNVPL